MCFLKHKPNQVILLIHSLTIFTYFPSGRCTRITVLAADRGDWKGARLSTPGEHPPQLPGVHHRAVLPQQPDGQQRTATTPEAHPQLLHHHGNHVERRQQEDSSPGRHHQLRAVMHHRQEQPDEGAQRSLRTRCGSALPHPLQPQAPPGLAVHLTAHHAN